MCEIKHIIRYTPFILPWSRGTGCLYVAHSRIPGLLQSPKYSPSSGTMSGENIDGYKSKLDSLRTICELLFVDSKKLVQFTRVLLKINKFSLLCLVGLRYFYNILSDTWRVEDMFIVLCHIHGSRGCWKGKFEFVEWAHSQRGKYHIRCALLTFCNNCFLLFVFYYILNNTVQKEYCQNWNYYMSYVAKFWAFQMLHVDSILK